MVVTFWRQGVEKILYVSNIKIKIKQGLHKGESEWYQISQQQLKARRQ